MVIIPSTTVEAIRDDFGKYNGRIATAAGMGRRAEANAAKEDERRREAATAINAHIFRDEYLFESATS
ncbi:hypothetical protein A5761_04375 [Mycolicibacterium setense]|uniref:hypothetical protein n=1 Tax=Mycolicibacterium setense TaxID=431269 RepID=UPI0007E9B71C|nr:hypothetical protein [Mycolicibacterium setense]OBB20744.1 hypothetical protein A5761_04375 [Mycolicibacterium setense]